MKNTTRASHSRNSESICNYYNLAHPVFLVCLMVFFALFTSCSSSSPGASDEGNTGDVAGNVLGKSGGSLIVNDPSSSLCGAGIEIPKDALGGDVSFSINETPLPIPLPGGLIQSGPCVSFYPHGQAFKRRASVFLPYHDSGNDGLVDGIGLSENRASVFYFNPASGKWEKQPVSYRSLSSNRAGIKTDHLSTFIVAIDETDPDDGGDVPTDTALVPGEYFTGPAEYTFKDGQWVLWPKGCINNESVRCGQSWNLTLTYRGTGFYAVIDRYTTMTGGYQVAVSDDFKSALVDVFAIPEFEKVKASGDAALWTWQAQFEKDHSTLTKYRVLDDSSLEAGSVAGEKIYADVEVVDKRTIKIDWKITANKDLIPGDILVVIFEAVYNG